MRELTAFRSGTENSGQRHLITSTTWHPCRGAVVRRIGAQIQDAHQGASYTHAVCVPAGRGLLFTAGVVARDDAGATVAPGDIEAQTRHILNSIEETVAEAGCTLDDVIKITFYLRDIERDLETIRRLRSEYWPTEPPASTGVEVSRLMSEEMRVEIEAVAVLPDAAAL